MSEKKLLSWFAAAKRYLSEATASTIESFSRPRKEIATASVKGLCPFKTAWETQNGSPEFSDEDLTRFEVGHTWEFNLARRFIARGYTPVDAKDLFKTAGPCICGGGDMLDVFGITPQVRRIKGVKLPTGQLSLEIPEADLGGNFDLVLKQFNGDYVIIEAKTVEKTDDLPEPRDYWVAQAKDLIYLLKAHIPQGTNVRCYVYARLGNTQEIEFEIFPPTPQEEESLLQRAKHIAAAKRGEVEPSKEPSYLCGMCPAKTCHFSPSGRKAHAVDLPDDVRRIAENYIAVHEIASSFNDEVKRCRKRLLDATGNTKFTAVVGGKFIKVSKTKGSVGLDGKKLKLLSPSLYEECCTKEKKGSLKLEVFDLEPDPA